MIQDSKNFSFNLDSVDHAVVDALRLALEVIMPGIMYDNNLTERNGVGQFRWNPIITQLRAKCQHLGWIDFNVCRRGAWKTPVLFHAVSRNLITFMTENTFKTVQRRKDKGKHYLCGGASFNQNVKAQYEQLELELPGVLSDMEKWVAKSREELANAICASVGEIEGHILVLFDAHLDKLLTVRAVRLTPSLEISTEEEDWTQYITMPYATNQEIEPQQNNEVDEEELVELL
ncbi:MAG: hypothetical protein HFH25_12650 [Lachnospiraceae bacterium]|nr:hypothetical protein [Lachnospiraceae bacterium]